MEELSREFDGKLTDIYRLLKKVTKEQLTEYDLTLPRFKILWEVKKIQPVSLGEVRENIHMANSTLSILVDKLVEDNFINRYRSSKDRRVVMVETTDRGKEVINSLIQTREDILKEALNQLEPDQKQQLLDLLEPVLNHLQKNI